MADEFRGDSASSANGQVVQGEEKKKKNFGGKRKAAREN